MGGQVSRITGIPPHIQNAILCTKLLKLCSETLVEVKELTTNIKAAVSAVYEEKAEENGYLTGERLKIMFDDYQDRVLKTIDDRIKDISMRSVVEEEREIVIDNFADDDIDETQDINSDVNLAERQQHRLYTHCGKMWHVPKNFSFPTNAKLLTGWQLWVGGQPGYKMKKVGMNEGSDEYQSAPVCCKTYVLYAIKHVLYAIKHVFLYKFLRFLHLGASIPATFKEVFTAETSTSLFFKLGTYLYTNGISARNGFQPERSRKFQNRV